MLGIVLDAKSFQSMINKISREISDNNKNIREGVIIEI
jgi:pyrimidine operon attenuation protein/uracil phosphoribosyltransferase